MTDIVKRKTWVAALSVASNSTLVILKVVVGLLIGSVSVISEAIHSGVDLLAAIIALFAVRTSHKPADREHPFGHGKIENISGTIEALLIFVAAVWIIYEAVHKLIVPKPLEAVNLGVLVMGFSALLNFIVSAMLFKVGKETESHALQADAWHLRTDVWTSMGVMAGLALIWMGEKVFPGVHFHWLDPVAAIGVALLIIRAAFKLTVDAGKDLMDRSLTAEEELAIRAIIVRHAPPARGFHRLRTRKAGSSRFVEFHLLVDGRMSVTVSHGLAKEITAEIGLRLPGASVTIHIEPCNYVCSQTCEEGCLLDPEQRAARGQQVPPAADTGQAQTPKDQP